MQICQNNNQQQQSSKTMDTSQHIATRLNQIE